MSIERWSNNKVDMDIWIPENDTENIYVEYVVYPKDRKRDLPITGAYFDYPKGDDEQGMTDLRSLLKALGLKIVVE